MKDKRIPIYRIGDRDVYDVRSAKDTPIGSIVFRPNDVVIFSNDSASVVLVDPFDSGKNEIHEGFFTPINPSDIIKLDLEILLLTNKISMGSGLEEQLK